ncbi:hypothetical protein NMG29_40095 [Streptomyces cocklensis]|uniref:Uncharacterized protein n=1 Tax=Actinacidiphila cocklensis TaxID=887465 RepID=A0A9W4GRY6_9ACTN|nr:hypothetical protein [Actinacidiphila cocklensis]MDD1064263.1 hypothetical protein [Actinacidiphila cocklensis]CAG6395259.1 hypothetical protein SCOCK_300068 [Actinacidiphila cocklensis]
MSDSKHDSPIYDELVEERGDAVADSRTAEHEARFQVEEALRDLRTVGKPGNSGWFT